MKTTKLSFACAAAVAILSLQSCLDFDVTGDEFNSTTENMDKVTTRGAADSIPYLTEANADTVKAIRKNYRLMLTNLKGGVYAMRGGKDGAMPGPHAYQYQFCLGADIYAQYGVIPHSFFDYSKINVSSAYSIDEKAYGGAKGSFGKVMSVFVPFLNHDASNKIPEIKAISLLLYDYSSVELADIYGPFAYQDLKTNKQAFPYHYDGLETIYRSVVENIDTIANCFAYFPQKPEAYRKEVLAILSSSFQVTNDVLSFSTKDLEIWRRFANSLKLRMAMHIVKVNPSLAQEWAEEAVNSGVIETEDQEVAMRLSMSSNVKHPLLDVYTWNDIVMTASMESLLNSLNHPYVRKDAEHGLDGTYLYEKNRTPFTNTKTHEVIPEGSIVVGMRTGAHPGEAKNAVSNQYLGFSMLNQETFSSAPLYLMKLSEVCFLRAEGAVRGWNMKGSAKEFYEQGIRSAGFEDRAKKTRTYNGLNLYDALVDDYMQLETALPYTYNDPTGDTDPIASVTKIGVKWNEGDTQELKLEKIITQKYIAGYPYSFEAWVDLRRTGYPKLFEVLNADESDGSLRQGDIIRRLYFPDRQDASVMQDITTSGLPALGGPDVVATRLWWDVDAPNF